MRKYILVYFLLLVNTFVEAQQDAQFSQYMFQKQYFNPAFSASEEKISISAISRLQWLGYEPTSYQGGSPFTNSINAVLPVLSAKSGFGLTASTDQIGPIHNNYGQLSYAYALKFKNSILSFGLGGGIYGISIDPQYRFNDAGDKNIPNSAQSIYRPDFSGGVYFKSKQFYAGISMTHLNKSKFSYGDGASLGTLKPHLYGMAGYNFVLSDNIEISVNSFLKNVGNKISSDNTAILTFQQRYWGGIAYRIQDAATILAGLYLNQEKTLFASYAFDYTIVGKQAKASSSHEIMISYFIPLAGVGSKPIIRTPRYRF